MKKIFYYICSVVMLFSMLFLSNSIVFAKENSVKIKKVEIEVGNITKNHSNAKCLTCSSTMHLIAKVHLSNGKIATGKNAKIKWELCRKDGTASQAVYTEEITEEGYAEIRLYTPYGCEEDLKVVAYAANNEKIFDTYELKTVIDERDGVTYFDFVTGDTSGKVTVEEAAESWNAAERSYTVILPEITTDGKDEFLGWQDEDGKLYSCGETVKKVYDGNAYYRFTAKWKTENGTIFVADKTEYKITGKNTVTLVRYIGKSKGYYGIQDKVNFHNNTYKVNVIGEKAFSKAALKEVQIGKNVTKIENKAFYKCKKLKKLNIVSTKLKTIGDKAIAGIAKNATIDCPDTKKKVYKKKLKKAGLKETMTVK